MPNASGSPKHNSELVTYRYSTGNLRISYRFAGCNEGFLLTTHERQQVPIQLAPKREVFVATPLITQGGSLGYLPEPQSLLRVEMDILPCDVLCTDVNILRGNQSTLVLLILGGTRFRACVRHGEVGNKRGTGGKGYQFKTLGALYREGRKKLMCTCGGVIRLRQIQKITGRKRGTYYRRTS